MRLLVLFVSLVLALPAAAQQACSNFELVGFSSSSVSGNTGPLDLALACQLDYADSRVCLKSEIGNTVNVPVGLSGEAWVKGGDLNGEGVFGTCNGESTNGFTVDAAGLPGELNCTQVLPVACCAAPPSSTMASIVPITSPVGRMILVIAMLSAVGVYWTRRAALEQVT